MSRPATETQPATGTIATITRSAERAWRPEIQGLRALALLLVAAYHFWFGRVSGGVDVFLLISAFLLTGSFARKLEQGKLVGPGTWFGVKTLLAYWVHVFKRLLPLASLTVALTLLGTYFFIPAERWLSIADEAKAVILYQHNNWSIENAVDYYAADTSLASPLRHFWSLSVQGQIYVLWPLLMVLLAAVLGQRLRGAGRWVLTAVFAAIFVVSLLHSVEVTAANQQAAYFETGARLWEFALGSLVALWLPAVKFPPAVRAVLGWVGIAAIISCGFILDVNGTFPGYAALWPTVAASLVIVAGDTGTRFGPEKLLTAKPLLALGGFSYALYLVHWPLLVFYLAQTHQEKAGFWAGLGLLLFSGVLAWALTHVVEKPLQSWALPNRSMFAGLVTGLLCVGFALGPSYAWQSSIYRQVEEAEAKRPLNNVGAAVLQPDFEYAGDEDAPVIPLREVLDADWADLGAACQQVTPEMSLPDSLAGDCTYVAYSPEPSRTIVAWGNSHMQMWMTAMRPLAESQGWTVIALTRPGCFLGETDNAAYASGSDCDTWAADSSAFIQELAPSTVLLQATKSQPNVPDALLIDAQAHIGELTGAGIQVLGLRDTPRMETKHKDCIDAFGGADECTMSPGQDVTINPLSPLEQSYPGFAALNFSDLICPENSCPVAIGNIYTYFDYDHITATYIETLGPYFDPRVLEALNKADASLHSHAQLLPSESTL
ncbi:MAG: acyltransferase family protein [Rothia sp. (in: high G+C Gram-positive bacteria)]|nr:acyltransferase family protein [Rothia sp. (in: high G+C Gram-positive bacteria)]